MVMPRARFSGALSIWSNGTNLLCVGSFSAMTFVIAAVKVVLPWSMWPIVPVFRCGLVRSNFAFAIASVLLLFPANAGDDFLGDRLGNLLVRVELHGVRRATL